LFDVFANNVNNMIWEFGDGNTLINPPGPHIMYAYNNAGTYNVKITATNGCGETVRTNTLYVAPGPEVAFDASKTDILVGETVTFTNKTNAVETMWVFDLDENDTTSATNTSRKYDDAGTYLVTLFALNEFGCWDTLSKVITVGTITFVNEEVNAILVAYPNPSNGTFTVNLNASS
jgi:PKD repeat protein